MRHTCYNRWFNYVLMWLWRLFNIVLTSVPSLPRATVVLCCAIFQFVDLHWGSRAVNRIVCQTSAALNYCGMIIITNSHPTIRYCLRLSSNKVSPVNQAESSWRWRDKGLTEDISAASAAYRVSCFSLTWRASFSPTDCDPSPQWHVWGDPWARLLILNKDAQSVTEIPLLAASVGRHFPSFN